MSTLVTPHIELDDQGRAWVVGANTKVIEIVMDKLAWGWTPEEMCLQHPHLTLAQIHAALSYYYDHQAELDTEIAVQVREYETLRSQAEQSPLRQKLRSLGKLHGIPATEVKRLRSLPGTGQKDMGQKNAGQD